MFLIKIASLGCIQEQQENKDTRNHTENDEIAHPPPSNSSHELIDPRHHGCCILQLFVRGLNDASLVLQSRAILHC